jgi:ABC-2 type transport system ATP-binding protein
VRLEARGIVKRYRRRTVLSGVDLTVRAGEVVAVVGANGSGKSTFLRVCAGLASPDAGTVRVDGALGYCPQDGGTCGYLGSDEHFVLVGAGRGLDRAAAKGRGHWRPRRQLAGAGLAAGPRWPARSYARMPNWTLSLARSMVADVTSPASMTCVHSGAVLSRHTIS